MPVSMVTASEATEPPDNGGGDATEPADDGSGGGSPGSGSATLTIGEESWSFDDIRCATSPEEAGSPTTALLLLAFGETTEGISIRLGATITDGDLGGRYEGDGVSYSVTFVDDENVENPTLNWVAVADDDGESAIKIDGRNVTADMLFDDWLTTPVVEEVAGTLRATCP